MEIVSKTILWQIVTQCAGTQDIIKILASCDPRGRKNGLKTVAFLLRLSIYDRFRQYGFKDGTNSKSRRMKRSQANNVAVDSNTSST